MTIAYWLEHFYKCAVAVHPLALPAVPLHQLPLSVHQQIGRKKHMMLRELGLLPKSPMILGLLHGNGMPQIIMGEAPLTSIVPQERLIPLPEMGTYMRQQGRVAYML